MFRFCFVCINVYSSIFGTDLMASRRKSPAKPYLCTYIKNHLPTSQSVNKLFGSFWQFFPPFFFMQSILKSSQITSYDTYLHI